MLCNVGPVERIVRLLLAGAAAVPVLSGRQSPRFRRAASVAAAAELFTAVTRFCPANALLRIDNCRGPGLLIRLLRWTAIGAGVIYLLNTRRSTTASDAPATGDGAPARVGTSDRLLPDTASQVEPT